MMVARDLLLVLVYIIPTRKFVSPVHSKVKNYILAEQQQTSSKDLTFRQ